MQGFRKRSSNFLRCEGQRFFIRSAQQSLGEDLYGRNWRKICKQTLGRAFAEDLQGSLFYGLKEAFGSARA